MERVMPGKSSDTTRKPRAPRTAKPAKPLLASVPTTTAPPPAETPARVPPVLKSVPTTFSLKEHPMATAFETTQETVKSTVSQLSKTAEEAVANGKAAMEQITVKSKEAVEQSMKSLDEMTEMARGNVEALLASARAASAGIEAIASHVADLSRTRFEEASTAMKAMTAAKTPTELMQLQSDFAKGQFDAAVGEFSKMTEMMVKLAGEVMEPVQNRIAIATDKLKTTFNK
jgi:phasin family protein